MTLKKLRQYYKNPFLKGSLIIFLASMLTNFGAYLFHLLAGQLLTPEDYGLLQSFVALNYFFGVFVGAFSFVVINFTAHSPESQVSPQLLQLKKLALKLSLFFWLFFIILFPILARFLHLNQFLAYFLFTLPLLFTFLSFLYLSVLRSRLKFLEFSIISLLSIASKVVIGFVLIKLGWQLNGALLALIFPELAGLILGTLFCQQFWPAQKKINLPISLKHLWRFSLLSLVTNFFLISLYSIDILLVRNFFSALEAGLYAAAATMGKIIFFAANAVLMVGYPLFVKYKTSPTRLKQTFLLAAFSVSIISLISILIYKVYPQLIIKFLYGLKYQETTILLPSFAFFISLLVGFNLLIQFLLSQEHKLAGWLSALVAIIQVCLIALFHSSLKIIIVNSIIALSFGLLLGMIFVKKVFNELKYH